MKKKRFELNKLVRDKIVDMYEKEGVTCKSYVLEDDEEYLEALTQKLIEEMQEMFSSETQEELVSELADFEEVLREFKAFVKIDQKDIEAAQKKKHTEKGGFSKRLFIDYIDVPLENKERIAYQEKKEEMLTNFDMQDLIEGLDDEDQE